ncbi:MAG: hypothetical protein CML42_06610 [Rhodobacteraceae bacterium]|nr:hypothetical protein [Paracoccaceae bacterium]|tara:strand:- start:44236 stop:44709 length:474 start_codon:yes stop_codon:yes gene_type:complete
MFPINGSTTNTRVAQMKAVHDESLELFARKNKDYGDSFAKYGPVGVVVRLGDKIERLSSITRTGITMVNDESVRDTLIDLHNYAAMAVMLMDEKANNEKKRRVAFREERDIAPNLPINPNFYPPMPPPGLLDFINDIDEDDDHLNAFKPVDIDKKRD